MSENTIDISFYCICKHVQRQTVVPTGEPYTIAICESCGTPMTVFHLPFTVAFDIQPPVADEYKYIQQVKEWYGELTGREPHQIPVSEFVTAMTLYNEQVLDVG